MAVLLLLSVGCDGEPIAATPEAVERVDYFADNGLGNAVAVVQHPAGEYHNGITYVAYQGPLEDPYVAAYDHATGEWRGPFQAGVSELGKDPEQPSRIDNHGKPTLLIDDAGYLHVFFGGHGGGPLHGENRLGNTHFGANKHAVSRRPGDITAWEELDNISPFGTYNQAVKMDNGDIYLFYRHGAHRSDWVYQKSTDNGRSFAPPVSFLKQQRRDDLTAEDSWYAWADRGENDDIIVVFDYHLCWDADTGRNGMGHTTERHDVFYMVMDTTDDSWHNVQGEPLTMPIDRESAHARTFVASTGDEWTFNGTTRLDAAGHPHININVGPHLGLKFGGPKQTRHYRWTGDAWVGGGDSGMPAGSGDFLAASPEDVRFLLAAREPGGDGIVAWWNSTDGGSAFSRGDVLFRRPKVGFAISGMLKNAHPDARVIVAEKLNGSDRRLMYLVGDHGPLGRDKKSAEVFSPPLLRESVSRQD